MSRPDEKPNAPLRYQRRNRAIGWISITVLLLLFAASFFWTSRKNREERAWIATADRYMAQGLRGDCHAFRLANRYYFRAMRRHIQNKELAGKASLGNEIAALCESNPHLVITARQPLLDTNAFRTEDIKALALAYVAAGDLSAALQTLNRLPDDPICKWLTNWLLSWPR